MSRSQTSEKPAETATKVETCSVVRHESLGETFRAAPDRPLLDCGLEQGLDMDYGCRVGACGACAVEVVEGAENLEEPDFIEQDALDRYELPRSVRLSCRACAKGPISIRTLDD